jgi:hypothetical protein
MLHISSFSIGLLLFSVLSAYGLGGEGSSTGLVLFLSIAGGSVVALTLSLLPVATLCRDILRSTAAKPANREEIARW